MKPRQLITPGPTNTTALGPKRYYIAEALDECFKTAILNMLKDIKEGMNKSYETIETAPDMKVEMESLQKIKTEMELEMRTIQSQIKTSLVRWRHGREMLAIKLPGHLGQHEKKNIYRSQGYRHEKKHRSKAQKTV